LRSRAEAQRETARAEAAEREARNETAEREAWLRERQPDSTRDPER
jgi:hypothetical protein